MGFGTFAEIVAPPHTPVPMLNNGRFRLKACTAHSGLVQTSLRAALDIKHGSKDTMEEGFLTPVSREP